MPAKRVLLLGAETDLGRACAEALAETGATLALVAATNDADAAFAVKRLARRLGAPVSQAIDATNEAAVRVMVRQVSKALGGIEAVVDTTGTAARETVQRLAVREMDRTGGGVFVVAEEADSVVGVVAGDAA
jgi:NAD(P)-dependent dehydrogenase (short-subunit alcohol dehydrogenase family)